MLGADSSVPEPASYSSLREVWGIYVAGDTPHVWTHPEVEELGRHGVRAVLPIVVPTQDPAIRWWTLGGGDTGGYEYTEQLVRDAVAWGVPPGSPLVLDIEEATATAIGASAHSVVLGWVHACTVHQLVPWIYAGPSFWSSAGASIGEHQWLAEWPQPTPETPPALPAGYSGWQYAGSGSGHGPVDLDVFAGGLAYLGCDLRPGVFGTPEPAPVTAEAAPVEAQAVHEVAAVASAVEAQATTVAGEAETGKASVAASVLPLLKNHLAELTDLVHELEAP